MRILIFIAMKAVEIACMCGVVWGLMLYGRWIESKFFHDDSTGWFANLITGIVLGVFVPAIVVIMTGAAFCGIGWFVLTNWAWAGRLAG